ncbi:pyridoxal phosphate-dependent aminotransferase [Patescibacteria group bacterium]|nr:pyridoxal phosphate-dependent aminotransferase [Patescibacteria group bacterium]
MDFRISTRGSHTPSSPIRKLHSLAESARSRGRIVYQLNIGQPDLPTPPVFFNQVKRFSEAVIAYAPSAGYPEVLEAWVQYFRNYKISFKPSEIIITSGASEALLFTLMAVADPGDEVIIFEPAYHSYISLNHMTGVTTRPVTLSATDGFQLPKIEKINKVVNKKTKAIIICNPSNPTGTVYGRRELQMIVEVASKNNLIIIADEVYREFLFDGQKHISMMSFPQVRNRVVLIDSVSKRFNLCGARVGCVASKNKEIIATILKFAQSRLSAPTLEQLGVIPLLKNPQRYTSKLVDEYDRRRSAVIKSLSSIKGVGWYRPAGAFYIMATLPVDDIEHFSRWLLESFHYKNETIMLAPGSGFYITPGLGKRQARIAFVLNSQKLRKAMEVLKQALRSYPKKITKK